MVQQTSIEQVPTHLSHTGQPSSGATLAVRGEAISEVDPELAGFTVWVMARDSDRATTLRRVTERHDEVRALLDRYGDAVERRETGTVSVYPEHKRRGEKVRAYVGSVSTKIVMTDFSVLGEVMLGLADIEQSSVHGPTWSLRPTSPVYAQTRRAAVAEAITRARDYADALGAQITGVVELADAGLSGRGETERPMVYKTMAATAARSEEPQLNLDPERQTVRATVEARFVISDPAGLW